jgi:hypothetical protein
MSIFLKAGSAAETDLRIQDSSVGPTDRHHIRVTWTAGVPSLSTIAGAGTLFTPQALTGGWYRIAFSATGVIAANSNRCGIFPARVAGATGTVYAWGFQPENATFPSSYIPTTTAAVTRAADALSFPFLPVPQAMTGYADIVAIQPSSVSSLNAIFGIGGAAAYLQAYQNNGAPSVEWNAFYSSTNHATGVATTLAVGTRLETRVTLLADGSTGGGTATGGGTETAAAASTTGILPAAWTAPTLSVANFASTSVPSFLALRSLKIAAGVQTMATMRAL